MRMSLMSEIAFVTGCVPFQRRTSSAPPRATPPREAHVGSYCLRVDIPLENDVRGRVATVHGKDTDWSILTRTIAHCKHHEKLGLECSKPKVTVIRSPIECKPAMRVIWHDG